MATKKTETPLDDARDAFEKLGVTDKTAFVFEAAFRTIGEVIGETGQMVADAMTSFDPGAPFGNPPADEAAEPTAADEPAPKPKRAAPRKPKSDDKS